MRRVRALFVLLLMPLALAACAVDVHPAPLYGHGYYGPRPYAYVPPPRRYHPPYRPYYGRPYGYRRGW